ncbi:MAG: substrate-binding domain-containing protein [Chthoniobacterales bacterium]
MRKRPRIYIIINPDARYTRGIYQGVTDYFSQKSQHYDLLVIFDYKFIDRKIPFEGIIALASTSALEKSLLAYKVPTVNVSSALEFQRLPTVVSNTATSGEMAAEHLLECKFHNFGFYGCKHAYNSRVMGNSFKHVVESAGFQCSLYFETIHNYDGAFDRLQQRGLQKWIASLPKPVGIFSGNDHHAGAVWSACDALELSIGKEVGIVGHGNDEFFCQTCHPQLSSVESRPDNIGYAAAELLWRLMQGEKPPTKPILIPPAGVVRRASSDVLMADDPHVSMAIQFIRDHLDRTLKIQDVFKHVPLSRRTLQRRFEKCLGHTLIETVQLLKIERIKHLLISTHMSMEEIADACGFSSASYMTKLFREKISSPPGEYRTRFRDRIP